MERRRVCCAACRSPPMGEKVVSSRNQSPFARIFVQSVAGRRFLVVDFALWISIAANEQDWKTEGRDMTTHRHSDTETTKRECKHALARPTPQMHCAHCTRTHIAHTLHTQYSHTTKKHKQSPRALITHCMLTLHTPTRHQVWCKSPLAHTRSRSPLCSPRSELWTRFTRDTNIFRWDFMKQQVALRRFWTKRNRAVLV